MVKYEKTSLRVDRLSLEAEAMSMAPLDVHLFVYSLFIYFIYFGEGEIFDVRFF